MLEVGHLSPAGYAPGGPEVEHHHLAAIVGQRVGPAIKALEGEARRAAGSRRTLAGAPGGQAAAERRRRHRERQQEPDRPKLFQHRVLSIGVVRSSTPGDNPRWRRALLGATASLVGLTACGGAV